MNTSWANTSTTSPPARWANPIGNRLAGISVAMLTTGKGVIGPHMRSLLEWIVKVGEIFPREAAQPASEAFRRPRGD